MIRELNAKLNSKIVFFVHITILVIIGFALLFILNKKSDLDKIPNRTIIPNFLYETKYILYFLLLLVIFIIIYILYYFIITRKSSQKIISKEQEKDAIIASQQIEIEKQNRLINNLTNLYNDAVEYDRIKTEFFSNISHDLKTPLSVILGAIQLIDQNIPKSSDRRKSSKHLKITKQNCYRLIRLLNNMLDITKMDSGFIKLNFVNCNIVYLIEEITQSVVPFAEQKGITLEFDTEKEEIITGVDVDKIERIILNLLSNAIKFTPRGGKVSVCINSRNDKLFISIKDNGSGIPTFMHVSIFERFKQVSSSLTKDFEGSGIGLSLVKSFVELHNGMITLISEENKGSDFIIELPIKPSDLSTTSEMNLENRQNKIIEAIHIEFSDIYSAAS